MPATLLACAGRSPSIADAGPPGPSLAFVALATSVGCDADADADADGVQLEVTVELVDDDGTGFSQVQVTNASNGATATASLADGSATALVDVVPGVEPAVANTLTATCENPAGDALEASAVVTVDCELPPPIVTCTFTAPAPGAVIAADRVDVAIGCGSSGLSAAQRALMASARLRVDAVATSGGGARSQELDLVEGAAAGTVLLPGSGAHTLTATLVDPDGLFDPDPSATVVVDVQP
ncbi:MAG: hypothetical protein A2138_27230 [Deltaproteobacteria bacterium RBG_16_71_12]|nr:MAG: hypothetical protein A2138_27230 [Deltaproteobacteria bacterium RBG_16_71_12]